MGTARVSAYLRLFALLNVAMLVLLVATAKGGVDRNGFLLGSDFISFWAAGRMLQAGTDVYDLAAHTAAQQTFFASRTGYTAFFYPPSFLPFCWPLGLIGYFPALVGWVAATGAIYVAAVREWARQVQVPLALLILAFPAVPIVATHGQTAFLVAGLLGGGLALIPHRPLLAGVLLGLATIKPQFGLLLPIVLLLTREWRAIFAAVLTAVLLGVLSSVLFGNSVWPDWIEAGARAQDAMMAGAVGYAKMTSPFAALRLLGAPVWVAYAVQGAISLIVAGMLAWVAWGRRWSSGLAAATLAGAPLATPFVLDYDMVLLAFPLLWLTGQGLRHGFADWEKAAIALAFAAPAFVRPLAMQVGLPILPLVLAFLFAVVWGRARREG